MGFLLCYEITPTDTLMLEFNFLKEKKSLQDILGRLRP